MTDESKFVIVVLIVAVLCLVWGIARTWPNVPVWLAASAVSVALALAVVAGVL